MKKLYSLLLLLCLSTTSAFGACDANTMVMAHLNGTDGSTTITDSAPTPNSLTANGNMQLDTAQVKFGSASGLFDGSGDYINIPDAAWMDFGDGDFTVDFWVRFRVVTGTQTFVSRSINYFNMRLDSGVINFMLNSSSALDYTWTGVAADTWYHLEFVRSGVDLYIFIDGSLVANNSGGSFTITNTTAMHVGENTFPTHYLDGWIDEFRISNVARHTSSFTAPTKEYCQGSTAKMMGIFEC